MITLIIVFVLGFACGWITIWGQQFLSHVAHKSVKAEMDERRRREKEEQSQL